MTNSYLRRGLARFAGLAAGLLLPAIAVAATPPAEITVGTLYASSGPFAVSSQGQYDGLKYWASLANKDGGVMVKAFGKKIPVKIIAYDDQSSTTTATTLYNQLITQDHVDVLVADFGSVLTSVAIPLAAEHHMLLVDPTASGANFFTKPTNYLADVSIPTSQLWPVPLGKFLLDQKIKRVAVIYDSNDFDASQANTLKSVLGEGKVDPVYFGAVPTTESNYLVLLHTVAASQPDAVVELGYPDNDIAFLHALTNSGLHFNMVFTIFPGQLPALLEKNVGAKALSYTYTYPTPPLVVYDKVTLGMATHDFVDAYKKDNNASSVNFLECAGYNTGIIVGQMLATAPQFTQLDFHQALMDMSGKTTTLLGDFKLNANGAQTGQLLPVAQLVPEGASNKIVVVYPQDKATAKAVYPAPQH